jgi:hypothetical protein
MRGYKKDSLHLCKECFPRALTASTRTRGCSSSLAYCSSLLIYERQVVNKQDPVL